jgi:hypothetical protein
MQTRQTGKTYTMTLMLAVKYLGPRLKRLFDSLPTRYSPATTHEALHHYDQLKYTVL